MKQYSENANKYKQKTMYRASRELSTQTIGGILTDMKVLGIPGEWILPAIPDIP